MATAEPPPKAQPMDITSDVPEPREPAIKKRTMEKRATQEISSIDAGMEERLSGIEARMDDRLNKLEAKMERMFETIKAAIAEKSRLDHERFVKIEGAVQHLQSHMQAVIQYQDPRSAPQGGIARTEQAWTQNQQ